MMTVNEFAKHFDLAYLSPNLQREDIIEACNIAKKYGVNAVNVNACWARLVVEELRDTDIGPSAVIGFPYGATTSKTKYAELKEMVDIGCTACDMVVNIGAIKDGDWKLVEEEINTFVRICGNRCATKLIFEVCFLNNEEVAKLTRICCVAGVDYVKTATGTQDFPDIDTVNIMKKNLAGKTKIKVSGVPRTFALPAAVFLINKLGVELIGTRSAGKIIDAYCDYYADGQG